jgi:hypothetical protein
MFGSGWALQNCEKLSESVRLLKQRKTHENLDNNELGLQCPWKYQDPKERKGDKSESKTFSRFLIASV